MRIVVALGGEEEAPDRALASLAREHQLVVSHGGDRVESGALALALRNHLPGRDVVSILTHVVLGAGADAQLPGEDVAEIAEPRAIAELRSLRALLDAGSLVLCRIAGGPVTIDGIGTMRPVEGRVDLDLSSSLLARRLDADLFVLGARGLGRRSAEAAQRFEAATGRRVARLTADGKLPAC